MDKSSTETGENDGTKTKRRKCVVCIIQLMYAYRESMQVSVCFDNQKGICMCVHTMGRCLNCRKK